ncbi:MAG: 50S ribosome-binding GTPase [Erysipelotrichaceae bacterium]|nr:50S ribosome-binding GTPase [Erysipelotrichaceae bacterium]
MTKCKGCGAELQCEDKNSIGYVVNNEQAYCQRCFRLSHYGDTKSMYSNFVTNEKILDIYKKYSNELFVVIIDILDALVIEQDDLLELFKDYSTMLVVNKTDLMPVNMTDDKISSIFSRKLFELNRKYPKTRCAILTNKFEGAFNEQFFEVLDDLGVNRVVFAGRANAGKSSLINKLIKSDYLTTSMYPGTTLSDVEIDFGKYIFIDTPGLVDVNNYSTHLNNDKYKLSKIDKTIKPQVFQFVDRQSYFYQGLLRVDVIPKEKSSIIFYINNNQEIHRTKSENADDYYQKHYSEFDLKVKPLSEKEYSIDGEQLFVIKGLGLFKINGKCDIVVHSLSDVSVYKSEVSI